MSFNDRQIIFIPQARDFEFNVQSNSYSDQFGKLKLMSNGCSIANASANILDNGDSISYGKAWIISCPKYSPTLCNLGVRPCVINKLIKLVDCNNDDPNCDYFSELSRKEHKTMIGIQANLFRDKKEDCALLRVYDIYGRLIFTTINCLIQEQEIPYSGIAIFRFSSKDDNLLKVQKRWLLHDNKLE